MNHKYITKFDQWLWDDYRIITTELTWEDYNKFQIFYHNNVDKKRKMLDKWLRIIDSMQKEESV